MIGEGMSERDTKRGKLLFLYISALYDYKLMTVRYHKIPVMEVG